MTLDEKLAQLGGVWVSELVTDDRFDVERARARLQHGTGHVAAGTDWRRVVAERGLPRPRNTRRAGPARSNLFAPPCRARSLLSPLVCIALYRSGVRLPSVHSLPASREVQELCECAPDLLGYGSRMRPSRRRRGRHAPTRAARR